MTDTPLYNALGVQMPPTEERRVFVHDDQLFRCGTCGAPAVVAPPMICEWLSPEATCPTCCVDHDFQFELGEGRRCITCHATPPDDWYANDEPYD